VGSYQFVCIYLAQAIHFETADRYFLLGWDTLSPPISPKNDKIFNKGDSNMMFSSELRWIITPNLIISDGTNIQLRKKTKRDDDDSIRRLERRMIHKL